MSSSSSQSSSSLVVSRTIGSHSDPGDPAFSGIDAFRGSSLTDGWGEGDCEPTRKVKHDVDGYL